MYSQQVKEDFNTAFPIPFFGSCCGRGLIIGDRDCTLTASSSMSTPVTPEKPASGCDHHTHTWCSDYRVFFRVFLWGTVQCTSPSSMSWVVQWPQERQRQGVVISLWCVITQSYFRFPQELTAWEQLNIIFDFLKGVSVMGTMPSLMKVCEVKLKMWRLVKKMHGIQISLCHCHV